MLPCDRRRAPSFETSRQAGRYGERVAARFLKRQGYKLLLENVAIGRGEIDLVCREGDVLAFVEVKTRADSRYGEPSQAVDAQKRAKLVRAAQFYLQELRNPEILYRFDIAEVFLSAGQVPSCRLIRDAFGVQPRS
ncbi:MAG: YraN family protein [Verrucomicrobium sp.]|nr:YraN family protein [Verrucomicrobium sp.]